MDYLHGFGNHFQSQAEADALPLKQNSPQHVPRGLYSEQISGSAFTAPRHQTRFTWMYRLQPSVLHGEFHPLSQYRLQDLPFKNKTPPTQLRWNPMPQPEQDLDFVDSLFTMVGNGTVDLKQGGAIHLYACNQSMQKRYFYNADAELLIVPQQGGLILKTELGVIELVPMEIAVIPRGIKFQVLLQDDQAYGYVCENFGFPFALPELGPIGANGLANPRDFQIPIAAYENTTTSCELVSKFRGKLWAAEMNHSPLNVVAWHGNYCPYKYDLQLFNTINTVSYDHTDPSIFTVLTSQSPVSGTANIDFVIFPDRWQVAEHTFRPPYFHRNVMSEFMGLIQGQYDAKPDGFVAGGCSLHNCMSAHGPDAAAYQAAIKTELKPKKIINGLAIMFESQYVWQVSQQALNASWRQQNYLQCWSELRAIG